MNADLLIKIKNAQAVKNESVKVPFSKINLAILDILKKNNYIETASPKTGAKKIIEVKLKYVNNHGAIHDIKLLSVPSRHLYIGYRDIRAVKQGYGVLILSTPRGIMDGKNAKKAKLGGELLFEIW